MHDHFIGAVRFGISEDSRPAVHLEISFGKLRFRLGGRDDIVGVHHEFRDELRVVGSSS